MKGLSGWGKFLFLINCIASLLLLIGYILPYIPPKSFPIVAVLALLLPVLIGLNVLFCGYWLIQLKRQFLLSGVTLLLGLSYFKVLIGMANTTEVTSNSITLLSYNVQAFKNIDPKFNKNADSLAFNRFISSANPDIVSIQEFTPQYDLAKAIYPYQFVHLRGKKRNLGQKIYSKFPIVQSGSLDFPDTVNNAIYVDLLIDQDTVRVYNVHFQSLRIAPQWQVLKEEYQNKRTGRMVTAFKKQEEQLDLFLAHQMNAKHPVIVSGDFNNSATSYLYRKVKGTKVDAFAKAGSGLGRTFNFDFIPIRIDFILSSEPLDVIDFITYDETFSDHYPIKATLGL